MSLIAFEKEDVSLDDISNVNGFNSADPNITYGFRKTNGVYGPAPTSAGLIVDPVGGLEFSSTNELRLKTSDSPNIDTNPLKFTGNMALEKIVNLADPTDDTDACTKQYIDQSLANLLPQIGTSSVGILDNAVIATDVIYYDNNSLIEYGEVGVFEQANSPLPPGVTGIPGKSIYVEFERNLPYYIDIEIRLQKTSGADINLELTVRDELGVRQNSEDMVISGVSTAIITKNIQFTNFIPALSKRYITLSPVGAWTMLGVRTTLSTVIQTSPNTTVVKGFAFNETIIDMEISQARTDFEGWTFTPSGSFFFTVSTEYGISRNCLQCNDNDTNIHTMQKNLVFQDFQNLHSYGGSFGGLFRLDGLLGRNGCDLVLRTVDGRSIEDPDGTNPFTERKKRFLLGFKKDPNSNYLALTHNSVTYVMNGTNTNSILDIDDSSLVATLPEIFYNAWTDVRIKVKGRIKNASGGLAGNCYIYINAVLCINAVFTDNAVTGEDSFVSYSSGSSAGLEKVSFISNYGIQVNTEVDTLFVSKQIMEASTGLEVYTPKSVNNTLIEIENNTQLPIGYPITLTLSGQGIVTLGGQIGSAGKTGKYGYRQQYIEKVNPKLLKFVNITKDTTSFVKISANNKVLD